MKLPEAVAAYVAYKQSLGMRFATEARTLKSFYRTLGDIDMREVSADRVYAFLAGKGPVTTFWHRKLGALRGYVVPTDNNVAYATAHSAVFDPAAVNELSEHVKAKFAGKVYWLDGTREGDIGGPLREIANAHPDTMIGSYPFQDEDKKPNTNLVVRSRDPEKLNAAMAAVKEMLAGLNVVR